MLKIDCILWTKNRSAQLDLCLLSTKKYMNNTGKVYIIYQADNDEYKKGYEKVMSGNYGLDITWIKQTNFNDNVKSVLSENMQTEYCYGQSDDNCFIDSVNLSDNFKLETDTVQFSLRLGLNHTYCQPANIKQTPPVFEKIDNIIKWNWQTADSGDYGYPHNCDSGIYNRLYWINKLNINSFTNPRTMEILMDNNRPKDKPYMKSFENCKLVSIVNNSVYTREKDGFVLPNMGDTPENLNRKWLNGYRIQLPQIEKVQQCHMEFNYNWSEQNG